MLAFTPFHTLALHREIHHSLLTIYLTTNVQYKDAFVVSDHVIVLPVLSLLRLVNKMLPTYVSLVGPVITELLTQNFKVIDVSEVE
jgi:hypothetical protein